MPSTRMRLGDLPDDLNALSGQILDAAIEVHRLLGPRLSEATYRDCLAHELRLRGLQAETEIAVPLTYKDLVIQNAYRLDVWVNRRVVVELKATPSLEPEHEAQVFGYLRATQGRLGLLINFHAPLIRDGFRRLVL